jgi:hypothetical protein
MVSLLWLSAFLNLNAAELCPHVNYLEKNQWGALEDILTDCKTGKLTTDECVLYGCYVLAAQEPERKDRNDKAKLIPAKYKLDKKSVENGAYFFVSFIYANEDVLGDKTLKEFQNSDWSDYEYIADFTSNEKFLEIINNIPFETDDKGNQIKSFCAAVFKAYKAKVIKPESIEYENMLARIGIRRYYQKLTPFFKKHKLDCTSMCPYNNYDKIERECPQIFENTKLCNVLNYYYYKLSHPETSKTGTFNVSSPLGDIDQPVIDKIVKAFYNYHPQIISFGFAEPVNFITNKPFDIHVNNAVCPQTHLRESTGITNPTPKGQTIKTGCFIELFYPKIKETEHIAPLEKTVIHELMHSIFLSYDDKTLDLNKYHWYLNNEKKISDVFEESTCVWASDYFYNENPLYNNRPYSIYKSAYYFFNNYKVNDFTFPTQGMFNNDPYIYTYSYSYFFGYLCSKFGNDFMKKVWEKIKTQKITDAFKTVIEAQNQKVADVLHDFATKNYLLNKTMGVFPAEDIFKKANEIWQTPNNNFPVLQIPDEYIPSLNNGSFSVPPYGTKFLKITPFSGNYFDECVTIDFSWTKGISDIKVSVISCWKDNQNNSSEFKGYLNTPVLYGGQLARYQYFTKKGLNPSQFIIVVTNGDVNEHNITISTTFSNPTTNPNISTSQLINNGGADLINAETELYKSGIIQAIKKCELKILELYKLYTQPNKGMSAADKEFLAKQIFQMLTDLKLLMDTTINQIHDIRYQYYLTKNTCVKNIIYGNDNQPTPVPVKDNDINFKDAIDRFETFMKDMDALIGNNNKSIYAINAFAVYAHVHSKLISVRPLAQWPTDELDAYNAKIGKINEKINKIVYAKDYPYWYTKAELNESVTAGPIVGMNDDEVVIAPVPPMNFPMPALVNYCPNVRPTILSSMVLKPGDEIYTISNELKGVTVKVDGKDKKATDILYLFPDTKFKCDPLSLRYFSTVKKHEYKDNNMPPKPSTANVKEYVSTIGYYMNICKGYAVCNENLLTVSRDVVIKGAADRIFEIIVAFTNVIIEEKAEGKQELYNALNKELALVPYKNEVLDLLEKQLKKDGYRE